MTMVPVIQADREAAADTFAKTDWSRDQYVTGGRDKGPNVQAFAKHRLASQAELVEALEVVAAGDIDISDTAIIVGNGATTVMAQVRAVLSKVSEPLDTSVGGGK